MHPTPTAPTRPTDVPTLEPGLTLLERPAARSPALHRLVASELAGREGRTLWIDAGGDASSYALHEHASADRHLAGVRLARAFTAYQHHALVERAVRRATGRTALVVAPCTAALYGDDDVHDDVSAALLASSLARLRGLADALEIPVLVTAPAGTVDAASTGTADDASTRTIDAASTRTTDAPSTLPTDAASLLVEHADRTIAARATDAGLRFEGEGVETTVYWQDGYWQTTIPYWVELFGCVCANRADAPAAPGPETPAVEG